MDKKEFSNFISKMSATDKSYAKGKKIRTDKNMEQIALRALF